VGKFGERSGPSVRGRPDVRAAAWTSLVLIVALGIWWFVAQGYSEVRLQLERDDASDHAETLASGLRISMAMRAALTESLAAFVAEREASGGLTREVFDTFAAGEYAVGSGIRTIQIAPGGVIRWTYPLKGSEAAIGLDLLEHPNPEIRADSRRAMSTKAMTVSGPYVLAQGGLGVVLRKAVVVDGKDWGLAAVVADVPRLIEDAGLREGDEGSVFAIADAKGRVIAGDAAVVDESPVRALAQLPEGSWSVYVVPSEGWARAVDSDVRAFNMQALAIVALLTLATYLLASRQRRLRTLVDARTEELVTSERRARALFERSPVSLWEEDFSEVKRRLDALKAEGVIDLRRYFEQDPARLLEMVALIHIEDVNQATLSLYDAPSKKRLIEGISGYSTPESGEVFLAQMLAVAEGSTEFWGDTAMRTPAGNLKHVAVRWLVMPGHEADYGSVVVSIVDLTDRVRAQHELDAIRQNLESIVERRTAELVAVNRELEQAQKAKDAFLANMSHELRTPLNSVLGFTGIMLQGAAGPLTGEQQKQLEMVRRSGRQLLVLVNDMLDLARIESGRVGVEPARVDAGEAATTAADTIRPMAEDKSLELKVSVPEEPLPLVTDADRLAQILLNLLANAVKFTQRGSIGLEVTADGEHVLFIVSDTGPGIPDSEREAIFRPFYQLPSEEAAKTPGSGLGLAIALDLAEILGGTLIAGDGEGTGAVFTLRLPRVMPDSDVS
jgi:signal transduction histidine kinase/sensor domain CHASE-containing protein